MVEFKPALNVGDVVRIGKKYYKVTGIEAIPLIKWEVPLDAGETKQNQENTNIYMDRLRLAQYRIFVTTDNVELLVKQPPATPRFRTKSAVPVITKLHYDNMEFLSKLTEIWVFEDSPKVLFDITNLDSANPVTATIYFVGWQYALQETTEIPEKLFVVPLGPLGSK